jgi:hypothetical protein
MSNASAVALATGNPPPPVSAVEGVSAPAVAAATTPPKDLDSSRFARLAKQEAENVKQRELIKAERAAVQADRDKLRPVWEQYENYQKTKATDPVAALKLMGFSETDIINYMAANDKPEPTAEEKAALAASKATEAALKAFTDNQAKLAQDTQTAKDTQIIQGYRSAIAKGIESDKEKFKYANHYGPAAEALAYEFALAVVAESKGTDVVSAAEAVQMVEDYYREQDESMSKLRAPKPESAPVAADASRSRTVTPGFPASNDQPKPPITKTRTLTDASPASVAAARHLRNESREDKRERLIKMLKG